MGLGLIKRIEVKAKAIMTFLTWSTDSNSKTYEAKKSCLRKVSSNHLKRGKRQNPKREGVSRPKKVS